MSRLALVGLLALMWWVIKRGVKKFHRRGYYRKVDTEKPLDDLEPLMGGNDSVDEAEDDSRRSLVS